MATIPKHPIVVFKLSKNVAQAIIDGRAVTAEMLLNIATFGTPVPTLASVNGHLDALELAETAVNNKTGTTAARDVKLGVVTIDFDNEKLYVQGIINLDLDHAADIAAKAKMKIKIVNPRQKGIFHAVNSGIPGQVKLFAGGKKRGTHEWGWSRDNVNYTNIDSTTKARTIVNGLTPLSKVYFRHRALTKDGYTAYEYISINVG